MKSKLLIALVIIFVIMQFIPVEKTNPPVIADLKIELPTDVEAILKRSCFDCHSNETIWPTYSKIAPFSWLVSYDVNEGRSKFNFSEWKKYSEKDKNHTLEELIEEVEEGDMPLPYYTLLHSEAKISSEHIQILKKWLNGLGIKEHNKNEENKTPHNHESKYNKHDTDGD